MRWRRLQLWRGIGSLLPAFKECAIFCFLQRCSFFCRRRLGRGQTRLLPSDADANGRLHRLQLQLSFLGRLVLGWRKVVMVNDGGELNIG
jgi:hypothetical protein